MTLLRVRRLVSPAVLFVAFTGFLALPPAEGQQKKKEPPKIDPEQLLKPAPRPKKPPIAASALPLKFAQGERIALVGNCTAERMNLFGYFETMLHLRHADKKLLVRNFARPADEVSIRQRSADYTKLDDPLYAFNPDTFLCFFGWNESFAGPAGVAKFRADYEKFLDEYAKKYARDDAGSAPRFVLISPIAFEPTGDPLLPDGAKENANLKLYADAVQAVAAARKLAFVDAFTKTLAAFGEAPGMQFTINGAHINEAGDKFLAQLLDDALFGPPVPGLDSSLAQKLREAVIDKAWHHTQDHRMVNGWYVYGGRRTYDTETFPREYAKLRNMIAVRDTYVHDIAAGKPVPATPDDSKTGELIVPPTRFGSPSQKYSEDPISPAILPPEEFLKTCTTAPGTELKLFADERKFPELAKPVQLNFDNKGRLWVACMPTYPQWRPGDPKPNDKLIILEDTDGDGVADTCKVFYDKLQCPTGFEFFAGGVLVVDQPRLLFLKDTDGDDKADVVVEILDGWATDDTHHTCGAFEWSHGGLLHMLEGIATSTTLETPWGPHRSAGAGGAYVFDPRTQKVRQFALPGQANMWCYVFDEWGQGIVGDGTTATHHWDVPLSGAQFGGRKSMNPVFNQDGMRPALGCEWLVSRNLPDEIQKQFTYACVINMNGMPRFEIHDDGAGFSGKRLKKDGKGDDLIRSTHKHFRPADPQIGPDGALYFGDWANPLIGHMQYSQRDPNRDHVAGRIYRLVGKDKPPVKPVTQFGKGVAEILEQFREYEWRTRYRARRELHDRPAAEVLPAVAAWVAKLDAADPIYDRLLCEALWIQQGHHAVDAILLKTVLAVKTPNARAAATHILTDERDRIPGAMELLAKQSTDAHPRVRTEALRGLSFYPEMAAVEAVVAVAKMPLDYWTQYTLEHALGANENVWRGAFLAGKLAPGVPAAQPILSGVLASAKSGGAAAPFLKILLSSSPDDPTQKEIRNKAMTALTMQKGNASNGRAVFARSCTACHKMGNGEGQDYGPNTDKVGTRLTRYKIVESIIDPNAEVDKKYLSTRVDLLDGKSISGLVVSDTKDALVIFDGKEKRTIKPDDIEKKTVLKQSSMPEGQAGTMAPSEFLDVVEYLSSLK